MKKITRKNLSELALVMLKIGEREQRSYVGGGSGTADDPYTLADYLRMSGNGTWDGGFVEGWGYTFADVTVYGNYGGPSTGGYGYDGNGSYYDPWGYDPWGNYNPYYYGDAGGATYYESYYYGDNSSTNNGYTHTEYYWWGQVEKTDLDQSSAYAYYNSYENKSRIESLIASIICGFVNWQTGATVAIGGYVISSHNANSIHNAAASGGITIVSTTIYGYMEPSSASGTTTIIKDAQGNTILIF